MGGENVGIAQQCSTPANIQDRFIASAIPAFMP